MKEARAKIRELQRLLGKKTMEIEILKEGLEYQYEKKWIPRQRGPAKGMAGEGGRGGVWGV